MTIRTMLQWRSLRWLGRRCRSATPNHLLGLLPGGAKTQTAIDGVCISGEGYRAMPYHSHSIVNGICKPLSHLELRSASRIFTVRFTVNLIRSPGIASSIYRHLSRRSAPRHRSAFEMYRHLSVLATVVGSVNDAILLFEMAPEKYRHQIS